MRPVADGNRGTSDARHVGLLKRIGEEKVFLSTEIDGQRPI
jgi:hypothetical protein